MGAATGGNTAGAAAAAAAAAGGCMCIGGRIGWLATSDVEPRYLVVMDILNI